MSKARFTDRLRTPDVIYRFAGGRGSPAEIETERPITMVHDVAGDAGRLGTRWLLYPIAALTAAGATEYRTVRKADVFTAVVATDERPWSLTDYDLWLLDVTMAISTATAANVATCFTSITRPTNEGLGAPTPNAEEAAGIVGWWDTALGATMYTGGAQEPMYSSLEFPGMIARLPRRVGRIDIRTRAGAGGIAAYRVQLYFAIAPVGVIPPALTGWT